MKTVDYQRQKVYNFELANNLREVSLKPLLFSINPMSVYAFETVAQAQTFVDQVLSDYDLFATPCPIRYTATLSRGSAHGSNHIRIGEQYRQPRYMLHEIAHIILNRRDPATVRSHNGLENRHGPQFVNLLIELWVRYCGDSKATLMGSAFKHRLIIAAEDSELTRLLALKAQANSEHDTVTAKLVRRQIRALNRQAIRQAAGTSLQVPSPVVRRKREPREYNFQCLECYAKYVQLPANDRCRKCGGSDLDLI